MSPASEFDWEATKSVCFSCREREFRAEAATDPDELAGAYFSTRRKEV